MQPNFSTIIGNVDAAISASPWKVFDNRIINFLDGISKKIFADSSVKQYKDLISIGFFLRKSSIGKMKKEYDDSRRMGVGMAFHITPSNIPVQFFYSLAVSLLAGNSNIIRVSDTEYEQTKLIYKLIEEEILLYPKLKDRICLIHYGHEKEATDYFSSKCDVRIIWGGNESIDTIRESKLSPRAYDVTFADRFSICLIDAISYIETDQKMKKDLAGAFYTDTYFSDQNACNSTRLVIWIGEKKDTEAASRLFWNEVYKVVKGNYSISDVSAVDKLIKAYSIAIEKEAIYNSASSVGNYLNVIRLNDLSDDIANYKGKCGLFFETSSDGIESVLQFTKKDWQTMTYYGLDPESLHRAVINLGLKGIDRITPIGKSGDPSMEWDGVNFIERLSRKINVMK